jgi:SAM-dependent methyltransferase
MGFDGRRYQARFGALEAAGVDVHGEAGFVIGLSPRSVLDAGCGTGRVAVELARRGVDVVGVDTDPSMITMARQAAPELQWVLADMCDVTLGRGFDVVVMAGNVPLFCARGTQGALVAGCARHLVPGGALVCGFQLDCGYGLAAFDEHCRATGLELAERWATWDREPFRDEGRYAVSVHRLRAEAQG